MRGAIRDGRGRIFASSRYCRLLPLAAAIAIGCAAPAGAATIAVNDAGGDSVLGKCTLADAVEAVNSAAAVSGCIAGDGVADTIDLSFFTAATTITFDNANAADGRSGVAFSKPATLHGPLGTDGKPLVTIQRSTVSNADFRVIGTSADLTIQGVAIKGGYLNGRGAGVYASGTANLTIADSVVSGNTARGAALYSGGGIASEFGNITLTSSTVSDNFANQNGGGIYTLHEGAISLTNSTVSGNHADYSGGGIYSFNGNVTIVGSTISGNEAFQLYYLGGNVYHRGGFSGGGVNVYQTLRMTNSTVTDNYARLGSGGVFVQGRSYGGRPAGRPGRVRPLILKPQGERPSGSPYLTGNAYVYLSTISGNHGNPQTPGTSGLVGPNYLKSIGTIITGNDFGDLDLGQLAFPVTQFAGSNNIIGSPPNQAPADTRDCDPKLGALGDYGGPTKTLPLLDGSCAIDTGPVAAPNGIATDQRGLARPVGGITDVGAFEKQGPDDPDIIFQDGFESSG